MRDFVRPMLILAIVLLIPVVPFVLFGDALEGWFADLFVASPSSLESSSRAPSSRATAAMVVGVLGA